MLSFKEKLEGILPKFRDQNFRNNKGLDNDVGFYIFDYPPEKEREVLKELQFVKNHMDNDGDGYTVKIFDIYELMLEILEEKGYLNKTFELERKKKTWEILALLQRVLKIGNPRDNLVSKKISENINLKEIIVLTGIGKSWPIIRSHAILNSLHLMISNNPVVIFFPGQYRVNELILFDKIYDRNYYRAFKLIV
jgi:hypothetical protein